VRNSCDHGHKPVGTVELAISQERPGSIQLVNLINADKKWTADRDVSLRVMLPVQKPPSSLWAPRGEEIRTELPSQAELFRLHASESTEPVPTFRTAARKQQLLSNSEPQTPPKTHPWVGHIARTRPQRRRSPSPLISRMELLGITCLVCCHWGSPAQSLLVPDLAEFKVKVILRTTVIRTVYPGIRPPSGIRDQFFVQFHGRYLQTVEGLLLWG
jgi:hypothetical protein